MPTRKLLFQMYHTKKSEKKRKKNLKNHGGTARHRGRIAKCDTAIRLDTSWILEFAPTRVSVSDTIKTIRSVFHSSMKKKKKKTVILCFCFQRCGIKSATLDISHCNACFSKYVSPVYTSVAEHVQWVSDTTLVSGRYDTGRTGAPIQVKSLYRQVSYQKLIRYDTRIVQLCTSS